MVMYGSHEDILDSAVFKRLNAVNEDRVIAVARDDPTTPPRFGTTRSGGRARLLSWAAS
jgi:hypothetical protein